MRNHIYLLLSLLSISMGVLRANENIAIIDSLHSLMQVQTGRERVETLLEISEAYRFISFDKTVETAQIAIDQSDKYDYLDLKAKILRSLGTSAYFIRDYDLALIYYHESLNHYEELNDTEGMAACYNNIGLMNQEMGNYMEAIAYYSESIKLEEMDGNALGVAFTYSNIGVLYNHQGLYDQAMEYNYRAQLIFLEHDEPLHAAIEDLNMAEIFFQWDQTDKAIQLNLKALEVLIAFEDYDNIAKAYNNLALIYIDDLDDFVMGLDYLHRALDIKEQFGNPVSLAMGLSNLGRIYILTEQYQQAEHYLDRAIQMFEENQNANGLVLTNKYFGELYQKTGHYKKSVAYFNTALKSANEFGMLHYISGLIESQLLNYVALGDLDNFLAGFRQYKVDHDSTIKRLRLAQYNEAHARARYDALASESQEMLRINKALEDKIKSHTLLITALGVLSMLVLLLIFFKRSFRAK